MRGRKTKDIDIDLDDQLLTPQHHSSAFGNPGYQRMKEGSNKEAQRTTGTSSSEQRETHSSSSSDYSAGTGSTWCCFCPSSNGSVTVVASGSRGVMCCIVPDCSTCCDCSKCCDECCSHCNCDCCNDCNCDCTNCL